MSKDDDDSYGNGLDEVGIEYDIEEEDIDEEDIDGRRPVLFRVAALITLLAFIGLVASTYFQHLRNAPLTDLIAESLNLKKDIDNNLMQAVVQVQVVALKNGSAIAVEQKHGTGFNINPQGAIVTNHHVVEGALNVVVQFPDGRVFKAVDWSSRSEYDLAVINLDSTGLPVVALDERGAPQPGDRIRVVGNPLSLNNIVVEGTVQEYLTVGGKAEPVFTIDAPIYPGNSGSPVYGRNGRVVGVVFGTIHRTENGNDKVHGLAIPIIEILSLTG
ncbi:MAG: serine protease [Syntrophomonadaceae bacterium]|nr:serine protease [Syntrophomonadaceae bacterium]